jgi:hypothetical protein
MTNAFYSGRYVTSKLLKKRKEKNRELPRMICFIWIKCHKTCNVSPGILQSEITEGALRGKRMAP